MQVNARRRCGGKAAGSSKLINLETTVNIETNSRLKPWKRGMARLEPWEGGVARLKPWKRGMARLEPWEGGATGNKQWKKGYSVRLEQKSVKKSQLSSLRSEN